MKSRDITLPTKVRRVKAMVFPVVMYGATGIPSPPLALFIMMLPKAHLTSHPRMSGIPLEIVQILKDNVLKVLYSICQEICKTQQ